jgi:hypothetical protein
MSANECAKRLCILSSFDAYASIAGVESYLATSEHIPLRGKQSMPGPVEELGARNLDQLKTFALPSSQ